MQDFSWINQERLFAAPVFDSFAHSFFLKTVRAQLHPTLTCVNLRTNNRAATGLTGVDFRTCLLCCDGSSFRGSKFTGGGTQQ
jgi:hypothetical protein